MSNRSHGDSAPCPAESPLSLHWIRKTLLETHLVQQGWNNAHGNQQQSCTEKRTLGVMKGSKENQSTAGVTGTSPISSTGLCSSCCCCAVALPLQAHLFPFVVPRAKVKWIWELSQVWKQSFPPPLLLVSSQNSGQVHSLPFVKEFVKS